MQRSVHRELTGPACYNVLDAVHSRMCTCSIQLMFCKPGLNHSAVHGTSFVTNVSSLVCVCVCMPMSPARQLSGAVGLNHEEPTGPDEFKIPSQFPSQSHGQAVLRGSPGDRLTNAELPPRQVLSLNLRLRNSRDESDIPTSRG